MIRRGVLCKPYQWQWIDRDLVPRSRTRVKIVYWCYAGVRVVRPTGDARQRCVRRPQNIRHSRSSVLEVFYVFNCLFSIIIGWGILIVYSKLKRWCLLLWTTRFILQIMNLDFKWTPPLGHDRSQILIWNPGDTQAVWSISWYSIRSTPQNRYTINVEGQCKQLKP